MRRILIIGSSGHAKVIIDIIEKMAFYEIVGLIDRFRKVGEDTMGYPVVGQEEDLPRIVEIQKIEGVFVAIGDNQIRQTVVKRIQRYNLDLDYIKAIHPSAEIGRNVKLAGGTAVMAGVCINSGAKIGKFCVLNTNSTLDHDSIMKDFSSLAPGVNVGGGCLIGKLSMIGIGATIIHKICIGSNTFIGAGSIVVRNIKANKLALGVPARVVRKREINEKFI